MAWPALDELKTRLNITGTVDDPWLSDMREYVIALIERRTQRIFSKGTHTHKERAGCDGIHTIYLEGVPVESITKVNGIKDYKYSSNGEVCFGCVIDKDIEIEYVGGYEPIPADVREVFYSMLKAMHATKDKVVSSGKVKSETVPGVYSVSYFDDSSGNFGGSSGSSDPANVGYYAGILDLYTLQKA